MVKDTCSNIQNHFYYRGQITFDSSTNSRSKITLEHASYFFTQHFSDLKDKLDHRWRSSCDQSILHKMPLMFCQGLRRQQI